MSAVKPSLGIYTFEDGTGSPEYQASNATLVQNPGGGGPALVIVPTRGVPFTATLRGGFVTIPKFSALIGTNQTYVKDGQTLQVGVVTARISSAPSAYDPVLGVQVYLVTVTFTLVSLT